MRKIILLIVLFYLVVTGRDPSLHCYELPLQANDLQSFCDNMLKKDNIKGCIIVYDIKNDKIIAETSPNIARNNYYPMGSVFKLVTAAAIYGGVLRFPPPGSGLGHPAIAVRPDPSFWRGKPQYAPAIYCNNHYKIDGKEFICTKPGGHGNVDLTKAIAYSCSIYFYNFYDKLGYDKITDCAKLLLDDKINKCKIKNPNNNIDFAEMLVGEGGFVQIKPVQAVNLLKHLIREDIKTGKGYYARVKEGMALACADGTAKNAGLNMAGKTGTPPDINQKGRFHGWFAGWAPSVRPRYAVVVFLEDGKGYEAAAIAGEVAGYCLTTDGT